MEKKLELKHLAAYLPYDLKLQRILSPVVDDIELTGLDFNLVYFNYTSCNYSHIKPILRPLSDLINVPDIYLILSFESIEEFEEKETLTFDKLFYWEVENLCKNHFDIFGLINSGLAIDINTLKTK